MDNVIVIIDAVSGTLEIVSHVSKFRNNINANHYRNRTKSLKSLAKFMMCWSLHYFFYQRPTDSVLFFFKISAIFLYRSVERIYPATFFQKGLSIYYFMVSILTYYLYSAYLSSIKSPANLSSWALMYSLIPFYDYLNASSTIMSIFSLRCLS